MGFYKAAIEFMIKNGQLDEYLDSLGASEDIVNFILNLPNKQKQQYIQVVRKNPGVTIEQLNELAQQPVEKVDPYLDSEKSIASRYPEGMHKWILANFRKLRGGKASDTFIDYPQEYKRFYTSLADHQNIGEVTDWYDSVQPDIASFRNIDQVLDANWEWHREMAQRGADREYQEGPENIVYGPEWKNPKFNGWTIRKVTTENDLLAEGYKMDHCVGDYCDVVDSVASTIYSLRDPENEPHVTMETTRDTFMFEQIQGKKNHEPAPKYKEMIAEWFQELGGDDVVDLPPKSLNTPGDVDSADELVENMDKLLQKSMYGYGLEPSFEYFDADTWYDYVMENLDYLESTGSLKTSDIINVAEKLATAVLKTDIEGLKGLKKYKKEKPNLFTQEIGNYALVNSSIKKLLGRIFSDTGNDVQNKFDSILAEEIKNKLDESGFLNDPELEPLKKSIDAFFKGAEQNNQLTKQASTTKIQKAMEAMDRKNKQVSIVDAARGNFNQEYDASRVKKEVPVGMSRVNMDVRMLGRMGYIAKNHDYRNEGKQLGDNELNPGESIWHRLDQYKSLMEFLSNQGSYKQQENKDFDYVYTSGPKKNVKMASKKSDKKRVDQDTRPYPNPIFPNYDYTDEPANETSPGGGFYHGPMDRHKSVKEFREKKRKELDKRKKKLESVNRLIGFKKLSNE